MNAKELEIIVPKLLDRYPGKGREVIRGQGAAMGWVLEVDDTIAYIRATSATNPFIWIRGGVAQAIPRTEALALHVAHGNKDLEVGRMYMSYGDDLAMVVFDESIFGEYLSLEYQPSIQDLVNRFEGSLTCIRQWAARIREEFGGRPFGTQDWGMMAF